MNYFGVYLILQYLAFQFILEERGNVGKKKKQWGKTIKDEETRCTLVKSGR